MNIRLLLILAVAITAASLAITPVYAGGEFLPVDTTSLILAAAQSPVSWLTSLTIAALGIGAYVITRNPNNIRNIKAILQDYLDRF